MALDECRIKHHPRQRQVWIAWLDAYGIYPSLVVSGPSQVEAQPSGTPVPGTGYTQEQLMTAHKFNLCRHIGLIKR